MLPYALTICHIKQMLQLQRRCGRAAKILQNQLKQIVASTVCVVVVVVGSCVGVKNLVVSLYIYSAKHTFLWVSFVSVAHFLACNQVWTQTWRRRTSAKCLPFFNAFACLFYFMPLVQLSTFCFLYCIFYLLHLIDAILLLSTLFFAFCCKFMPFDLTRFSSRIFQ